MHTYLLQNLDPFLVREDRQIFLGRILSLLVFVKSKDTKLYTARAIIPSIRIKKNHHGG